MYPFIHPSTHPCIHRFIYPSIQPSIHPSRLSILFILSIHPIQPTIYQSHSTYLSTSLSTSHSTSHHMLNCPYFIIQISLILRLYFTLVLLQCIIASRSGLGLFFLVAPPETPKEAPLADLLLVHHLTQLLHQLLLLAAHRGRDLHLHCDVLVSAHISA